MKCSTMLPFLAALVLHQICWSSGLTAIAQDGHSHGNGLQEEEEDEHGHGHARAIMEGRCNNPLLFVFGASMVDTGQYTAALPYSTDADFPPYGTDYFSQPAGRWSNGRVITDFITQALGYGFLNPYFQAFNSNFTCGANFAVAGSKAVDDGTRVFPFPIQLTQFEYFLSQTVINETSNLDTGYTQQQVNEAIYFIETASNDYSYYLLENIDFNASTLVSDVINSMKDSLKILYGYGARKILVMSVTPLGCAPPYRTIYASSKNDEYGCKAIINSICKLHNQQLETLLHNLHMEFSDAKWIYFDAYSIFFDGYKDPMKYGIQYPFKACCGLGEDYNYIKEIQWGSSGFVNGTFMKCERCSDPTLHLIWDTVHPTESFARYVAEGVVSGSYLRPKFDMKGDYLRSM